jgi:hypothetical protein
MARTAPSAAANNIQKRGEDFLSYPRRFVELRFDLREGVVRLLNWCLLIAHVCLGSGALT